MISMKTKTSHSALILQQEVAIQVGRFKFYSHASSCTSAISNLWNASHMFNAKNLQTYIKKSFRKKSAFDAYWITKFLWIYLMAKFLPHAIALCLMHIHLKILICLGCSLVFAYASFIKFASYFSQIKYFNTKILAGEQFSGFMECKI